MPRRSAPRAVSLGNGIASDTARGHGRLLCVRGTARRPRAARQAGHRRRHGRRGVGRRRATRCAGSACIRPCPCARRCGAARMRSACHRRIAHYAAVSQQIFAIFHEFTPLVQGLSLDEAFLDVTAERCGARRCDPHRREIKRRVHERTSSGVGRRRPNKLVAKIASDLRKPDGLVVVRRTPSASCSIRCPIRKLFGLARRRRPRSRRSHPYARRAACRQRVAIAAGLRRYTERVQQRRRDRRSAR